MQCEQHVHKGAQLNFRKFCGTANRTRHIMPCYGRPEQGILCLVLSGGLRWARGGSGSGEGVGKALGLWGSGALGLWGSGALGLWGSGAGGLTWARGGSGAFAFPSFVPSYFPMMRKGGKCEEASCNVLCVSHNTCTCCTL